MNLEISKILSVSTAHISKGTCGFLCWLPHEIDAVIYKKGYYGWFILTCDLDEQSNIPNDLWKLMKFSEANGCDWLNIDVDGPIVDGLETYSHGGD